MPSASRPATTAEETVGTVVRQSTDGTPSKGGVVLNLDDETLRSQLLRQARKLLTSR